MSERAGNAEIYVMDSDGTKLTRLTNHSSFDAQPTFSSNGKQILFHSARTGNFELFIMDADGTSLTQLTNDLSADLNGSWTSKRR
jgi:Tol biopolymer transport system component